MSSQHTDSPRRGEIERLVSEQYEPLKTEVLATVEARLRAARSQSIPRLDLEGAYNTAWHAVCRQLARGGEVENLPGMLVTATYRLARNVKRSRKDDRHTEADTEILAGSFDLASATEDRLLLQQLFAALAQRLNQKERNGVVLCLLYGYSRAEAAHALGMREPAFQKLMDRATKKLEAVIGTIRTRGCDGPEWAKAIRFYALGEMSNESPDFERVRAHLESCTDCRRYAAGLQGLALLPPLGAPLLPILHTSSSAAGHFVRRLLHPARAILGGSARQSAATATRTSTANLTGLAGTSTAVKTAAVIALAAIAVSVPVLSTQASTHHHNRRQPAISRQAEDSVVPATPAKHSIATAASARSHTAARHAHRRVATRHRKRHTPARAGSQNAEAEFGFERPTPSNPSPPPSPSPAKAPEKPSTAKRSEGQPEEFGFEH